MELLDITSAFYSWIRGGLLVLFVYHFVIYLQNKDNVHKYYSIYLFCLTVYVIRDAFTNPVVQHYYEYISFSIQYMGYAYFVAFCRSLVNCKKYFPKLDKNAKILSYVLLAFSFTLVLVQYFFGYEVQKKVVAYSVPLSSFCAFYVFYILSKRKTRQVKYLLVGAVLFLIFANISSIKMIRGEFYLIDFKVHRMFYYFVGAIIQSTIYAILIGNYFKEIFEKKREAEISLLTQSNQISELKMIALKSQMNPHFLFNSLNSINNYVIQNKVDEASNYITKFSSLVRKVLQATNENTISLEEELQIIAIYVKLEQMRLKGNFTVNQTIDKTIPLNKVRVVPLFMQPFIENAIWHGLSLKKGDKKLSINITRKTDNIEVSIKDNGIGIRASKNRKSANPVKRKSYGINIVKERMRLMYGDNYDVVIEEISCDNETGTLVVIRFPLD
ncbi:Histidine kinase-, DNA gyrase B-, and HSP90-like ATPase [Tenacibaculum sp. 190130A14a]|uniref:Histidine kinase-, DNA gyrase B-, and HSP90-like ATPase n=1 Tax=Tenacibaculum polynesiense TaxID=3137857 RepID=A0ABM9PEE6_9FLAO